MTSMTNLQSTQNIQTNDGQLLYQITNEPIICITQQKEYIFHKRKKQSQIVQTESQQRNSPPSIFEAIKLEKIIIKSIGDLLVTVGLLQTNIYSALFPWNSQQPYECEDLINLSTYFQHLNEELYHQLVESHQSFFKTEDEIVQEPIKASSKLLIDQLVQVCFEKSNICVINLNQANLVHSWIIKNLPTLQKAIKKHKITLQLLDAKRIILSFKGIKSQNKKYQQIFLKTFHPSSNTVKDIRKQIVSLKQECSFSMEEIFQYIWTDEYSNKESNQVKLKNILKLFSQQYNVIPKVYLSIHEENNKYLFNSHLKLKFKIEEQYRKFIKQAIQIQFGSCLRFKQNYKYKKKISFQRIQFNNKLYAEKYNLKEALLRKLFKNDKIQSSQDASKIQSSYHERKDMEYNQNYNCGNAQGQQHDLIQIKQKMSYGMYSIKTISQITQNIFQKDIFYLRNIWKNGFQAFLFHIYENWSKYLFQYEESIKVFVKVLQYKVGKIKHEVNKKILSLYESVCPQISKMIQLFKQKLFLNSVFSELDHFEGNYKYKNGIGDEGLKQQFFKKYMRVQYYENLNDKLLSFYFDQKQRKRNNLSVLFIKVDYKPKISPSISRGNSEAKNIYINNDGNNNTKIPLSEYIYNFGFFHSGMNRYQDLLNQINQKYSFEFQEKNKDQIKNSQFFLENIAFERVVDTRCLGCSPFFYYRRNIMDDNSNQILVRTFQRVQRMKDCEAAIKDQICMMLNNGGGIILFDCLRQYRNIEPVGTIISQIKKDEYQQRISSYLNCFYPKIEIKTNIKVTFVPLLSNPWKQNSHKRFSYYTGDEAYQKKNQPYSVRDFLKGLYVTRIRVVPDPTKVYFWTTNCDNSNPANQDPPFYCSVQKYGHRAQINSREMIRLFKKRFNFFYIPEYIDPISRKFLKKPSNCFNHQCLKPEGGIPTEKVYEKPEESNDPFLHQRKYDYLSMLIAKKGDFPVIQERLNAKRKEKDCKIQVMFSKYKFRVANNTAILFHQRKFEEILKTVNNNKQYEFKGKNILLISVTNYLLLYNRNKSCPYPKQDFSSLTTWLHVEFPQEQLKLWEFTTADCTQEYYIQTDTKTSTVFMYYLLNNFNQKTSFKNPLHLDKLSEEEFKNRMKLVKFSPNQNNPKATSLLNPDLPKSPQQYFKKYLDTTISTQDSSFNDLQEGAKQFNQIQNSSSTAKYIKALA